MNRDFDSRSLQLVSRDDDRGAIVDFCRFSCEADDKSLLRSEARALEATYGHNAYSEFLLIRERRPTPTEAANIGRLLGARVRADDGTMQPPLSNADRAAAKIERQRVQREVAVYSRARKLTTALNYLAIQSDLTETVRILRETLDELPTADEVDSAICWLSRLAEALHGQRPQSGLGDSQSSDC
jgi:hypothetical protein